MVDCAQHAVCRPVAKGDRTLGGILPETSIPIENKQKLPEGLEIRCKEQFERVARSPHTFHAPPGAAELTLLTVRLPSGEIATAQPPVPCRVNTQIVGCVSASKARILRVAELCWALTAVRDGRSKCVGHVIVRPCEQLRTSNGRKGGFHVQHKRDGTQSMNAGGMISGWWSPKTLQLRLEVSLAPAAAPYAPSPHRSRPSWRSSVALIARSRSCTPSRRR